MLRLLPRSLTPKLSPAPKPSVLRPKPFKSPPTAHKMSDSSTPSKLIFAPGTVKPTDSSHPQASQFSKSGLSRSELDRDPFTQFHSWYSAAQAQAVPSAETATLSTASLPSGRVSARTVYLKELDVRGFVVYSNWATSRKAADLAANPRAALTFWWRELERQVRVEGAVERLTADESQAYFDTRARGSRIGAWASAQSTVLRDRAELDERVREVERRFEGVERIPCPEFWGGLRLRPDEVEFWQGRESRLHDRFRYVREEGPEGGWKIDRLSP